MAFHVAELEHPDGTPAEMVTLISPTHAQISRPELGDRRAIGDKIPFGPGKPGLLVVGIRNASEPTQQPFSS